MSPRSRYPLSLAILTYVFLSVLGAAVPVPYPRASWTVAPEAFVVLNQKGPGDARSFVDALASAGGHVSILYPKGAAVVYASDAILGAPKVRSWIAAARRDLVEGSLYNSRAAEVAAAARAWNHSRRQGDYAVTGATVALKKEARWGVAPPPDAGPLPLTLMKNSSAPNRASFGGYPLGAERFDTSEYMAGAVAVGVWLLGSPGTSYVWTQEEKDQSLAGVQAGLDAWVHMGGTAAFLTFILEVHDDVTVSGVPIKSRLSDGPIWVDEVLTGRGWSGANAFYKCFAYNNSIRDRYRTNWCYSLFIVDSDVSVNEGLFAGGGSAWAYYGGPWVYMSRYSTWAYNSTDYWAVVPMHETGHIFMATDEYDGISQASGYLNSMDSPDPLVRCIMNQNDSSHVCQPTRDQIGWRDLDENGVIDPLDMDPLARLEPSTPDPNSNPRPLWQGTASVELVPNMNPNSNYSPPHPMTIATIDRVECRIDEGPWQPATSRDGSFDSYTEGFFWRPSPQGDGTHVVEARAHMSAGNWTSVTPRDTITSVGTVPAVPTLAEVRPNPIRSSATLEFTIPSTGYVYLRVYDSQGRLIRTLVDGATPAGRHLASWSGVDEGGRKVASGVYLLRIEFGSFTGSRRMVYLR